MAVGEAEDGDFGASNEKISSSESTEGVGEGSGSGEVATGDNGDSSGSDAGPKRENSSSVGAVVPVVVSDVVGVGSEGEIKGDVVSGAFVETFSSDS